MEVKCCEIALCYNVADYDSEYPMYKYTFSAAPLNSLGYEPLPIIEKLTLLGKSDGLFKIGENYSFVQETSHVF